MKWRKEPEDAVPTGDTRDAEDEGAVRTDAHNVEETREERERDGDMRERTEEVSPAFEAGAAAPPRTAAEIAAGAAAPDPRDAWDDRADERVDDRMDDRVDDRVDDRADDRVDDRVDDRGAREPVGPLDTDADIRTTADTDHDGHADIRTATDTGADRDYERAPDTDADIRAATDAEPPSQSAVGAAVTRTDEDLPEQLIPVDEAERMRGRWRDLQAGFVDDPHGSVEEAEQLVGAAMAALTKRFEEHRSAVAAVWHEGDARDTERLRVALRHYRQIFDSVVPS